MHIEAVMKMVTGALLSVLVLSSPVAAETQSVCVFPPVIYTTESGNTEPTSGVWAVAEAQDAYDLKIESEPLRHFVILAEAGDELAESAPEAVDGEFLLYYQNRWWTRSEYNLVHAAGCLNG